MHNDVQQWSGRLHQGRVLTTTLLIAAWAWPSAAWAEDWQPARLWVTGTERSVWVVARSAPEAEGLPVMRIWHAGKKADRGALPKRNRFLPAVSGDPAMVGADAEALRVLFSDLSARDYYDHRESILGAGWRGQCTGRPLAWGGDVSAATFWALVETEALTTLTTQPDTDEPATAQRADAGGGLEGDALTAEDFGNGEEAAIAAEAATDGPLTLLRLHGGLWRRLPVLSEASEGERFWLSGAAGDLYLFWQEPGRGVHSATLAGGLWTGPELVTTRGDVEAAWAGAHSGGPVFVFGVTAGEGGVELWVSRRPEGAWMSAEAAREGLERLVIDPAVCGVGIARGQLAVARPVGEGGLELGLGDLGVSPSMRFSRLSPSEVEPQQRSFWEEAIVLGLVIGMMTLVFWARREQMIRVATVPDGMVLATAYRRVIATILDCVPAIFLVMLCIWPWLIGSIGDVSHGIDLSRLQEQAEDPGIQAIMVPAHYASIVLYGLWCMIWELSMGTTPGKLLFGCRVLSADGGRAGPRQIVIRNVARVVVFLLGPPGLIMTLMTMLIVTRSRQRLGDLLANTIVVEPGTTQDKDRPADGGDRPSNPPGV